MSIREFYISYLEAVRSNSIVVSHLLPEGIERRYGSISTKHLVEFTYTISTPSFVPIALEFFSSSSGTCTNQEEYVLS